MSTMRPMNIGTGFKANTFIGGIAPIITSEEDVVSFLRRVTNITLQINPSEIKVFEIIGNDVQFYIETAYTLHNHNILNDYITYYRDEAENGMVRMNWTLGEVTEMVYCWLPNLVSLTAQGGHFSQFLSANKLEYIYSPLLTNFGGTTGFDYVFRMNGINNGASFKAPKKWYLHPSVETNNGGNPDPDIADGIAKGCQFIYVPNIIAPSVITNFTAISYNQAIVFNWSIPQTTNAIDYYEVEIDGEIFKTTNNSYCLLGLNAFSTHKIKVRTVDIYFNISVVATFNASTNATPLVVPAINAVSNYPTVANFNDNVGSNNAIDNTGGYNVNGAIFNSKSHYAQINNNASLNFNTGGVQQEFSITLKKITNTILLDGVNFSSYFLTKHHASDYTRGDYVIYYFKGFLRFELWDYNSGNRIMRVCPFNLTLNQVSSLGVYFKSNTEMGIVVNGVELNGNTNMIGNFVAIHGEHNMAIGIALYSISWNDSKRRHVGTIGDITFWDKKLTNAEFIAIANKHILNEEIIP